MTFLYSPKSPAIRELHSGAQETSGISDEAHVKSWYEHIPVPIVGRSRREQAAGTNGKFLAHLILCFEVTVSGFHPFRGRDWR